MHLVAALCGIYFHVYKVCDFYIIMCKAMFALSFEWFAKQGIFRVRAKEPVLYLAKSAKLQE